MRLNGDLYEYVAMYVDDLCLGMLDPKSFTDTLQKKYNFKLKGTGPIDFNLGQSFSRNDDGEMEISAKHYIDQDDRYLCSTLWQETQEGFVST
jgi:hypothetical protein